MPELDLLTITRGHVSAPAGYGKTQLIADSLKGHEDDRPVLVLTHTNAGVAALRKRLAEHGISSRNYVLQTLDGWALRLLNAYPLRSGIDPQRLAIANPKQDYPAIQAAARDLIAGGCIDIILQGSYSRLWVDEYQDCSAVQHEMVVACANLLPTVVLGDPMQSVMEKLLRRRGDGSTLVRPKSVPGLLKLAKLYGNVSRSIWMRHRLKSNMHLYLLPKR